MVEIRHDAGPIAWDDRLLTGVEVIDLQHKNLLNMVNDAYVSLSDTSSPEALQRITKELLSYAIYHFQTEESLMREYRYDEERTEDAEAHRREHRMFSDKVVSVRGDMMDSDKEQIFELLDFLKRWITSHISQTDKKLGNFLAGRMD
ncbi:MAG: bacteriohemerythrin [Candidatus Thiodiazotropha sp. (ex Epidulcina cf. delphinae)]|nr:bacteriohemerythrin [Candidatus Thiodiazotropha sp. (ex Epidulcina cf. delphinae)]